MTDSVRAGVVGVAVAGAGHGDDRAPRHRAPVPQHPIWPWVKLALIVAALLAVTLLALWAIKTLSDHTTFFEG